MLKSRTTRVLSALLAAVVVLALGASGAYAAGAPEVTTTTKTNNGYRGITNETFRAEVNPHGASTTAHIEYRSTGTGSYTVGTSEQAVGSGFSNVVVNLPLAGLLPEHSYEVRISATNSFGTGTGAPATFNRRWALIKTGGEPPTTPYGSSGTATYEWWKDGITAKIECAESGYGTIGNVDGKGDILHEQMSGCSYYQQGVKMSCTVPNFTFNLNGSFVNEAHKISIPFAEEGGCYPQTFFFTANTFTTLIWPEYLVELPVTVSSADATYANAAVTITINSKYFATGENIGLKLGLKG
jgi:hypothetical protein